MAGKTDLWGNFIITILTRRGLHSIPRLEQPGPDVAMKWPGYWNIITHIAMQIARSLSRPLTKFGKTFSNVNRLKRVALGFQ